MSSPLALSKVEKVRRKVCQPMSLAIFARFAAGTKRPREDRASTVWLRFPLPSAGEDPVPRWIVGSGPFPGKQRLGLPGVERNRFLRDLRLAPAHSLPVDRASDREFQLLEIDIEPLEADQLTATQPGNDIEQSHRAITVRELVKQC